MSPMFSHTFTIPSQTDPDMFHVFLDLLSVNHLQWHLQSAFAACAVQS